MSVLKFKHSPCEKHAGVTTSDNWCPVCLIEQRDAEHAYALRLKAALNKIHEIATDRNDNETHDDLLEEMAQIAKICKGVLNE